MRPKGGWLAIIIVSILVGYVGTVLHMSTWILALVGICIGVSWPVAEDEPKSR